MNQLNNFTDDKKENELNLPNCKYRDPDYFKNLTKDFKRKASSFFYVNVCSLTKHFDDFNSFDVLVITESRIKKDSSRPINLSLNNYWTEHTQTESSAGGTLLFINKRLSYQLRNDLRIYDPGKVKSTFIEIICSKSTNVIVGCICKHQKESLKRIFPLGGFNIDLLKHEISDSMNFIDTHSSDFLLPLICLPTRISKTSTLINNISSNLTSLEKTELRNVT